MKFFAQPEEIPIIYLRIPNNLVKKQLYYFEKLDLVLIHTKTDVFVYKIQKNNLIQNAYTNQQEELINTSNRFLRRFSFQEEREQIYVYVEDKLFIIQEYNNHLQNIGFSINQKFKYIYSFKVTNTLFLSNTDKDIYINRRNNLKYVLRYKSKEEIYEIIDYQQIIIINHHQPARIKPSNISIFLKQSQSIKMIRKLYNLKTKNLSFSSKASQLFQYDQFNNSASLIDLANMQKIETYHKDNYQIFKTSFFMKQLGLFVIHMKDMSTSEHQEYINHNIQIQTITTRRQIRFIKYSQRYGLLVFYQ